MKKEEYCNWLKAREYAPNTIKLQMARAKKVEQWAGDLDGLFDQDRLDSLLRSLTVTYGDNPHEPPRLNHSIPIGSSEPKKMTASYRSAINLYRKFRLALQNGENGAVFKPKIIRRAKRAASSEPGGAATPKKKAGQTLAQGRAARSPKQTGTAKIMPAPANDAGEASASASNRAWPAWARPRERELLEIVSYLTPYVRFLAPEIVAGLVQDNEQRRQQWTRFMADRGLDIGPYLWPKSSCAFPGLRSRSEPGETIPPGPGPENGPAVPLTDDNQYPKLLWSFLLRGASSDYLGPEGYVLVRLMDQNGPGQWTNFLALSPAGQSLVANPHGLFTCASNLVYLPYNFLNLLDADLRIRLLLLHKAQELYGAFCHLAPPPLHLKPLDQSWSPYRFSWSPGEGGLDYLRLFLAYRQEQMNLPD